MVPKTNPRNQVAMRKLAQETCFGGDDNWRELTLLAVGLLATFVCVGCTMLKAGCVGLSAVTGDAGLADSDAESMSLPIGILMPGIWINCSSGRTRPKQRRLRHR